MSRLAAATLFGVAQAFELQPLEEFSAHWTSARFHEAGDTITTEPISWFTTDSNSNLAMNVRNLQFLYLENGHANEGVRMGPIPIGGQHYHEELHFDGLAGRASYNIACEEFHVCLQVDHLPPIARMEAPVINQRLHVAEQRAPVMAEHMMHSVTVDGVAATAFVHHMPGDPMNPAAAAPATVAAFTADSHPLLIGGPLAPFQKRFFENFSPRPSEDELDHVAMKFESYTATVGSQFEVRACEISSHATSQALLALSPDVKEAVASRIAFHQENIQRILEPYNKSFTPLEIEDFMVPVTPDCANDELAQTPKTWNMMQVAACSVGAFVTGIAVTFAALRKRHVTPADDYHQVA